MKIQLALLLLVGCGVDTSQMRLRTAIDMQQEPLHRCYSQALMNDPGLEGTMRVLVRVPRSSDRIDMVEARDAQLTNTDLHAPLHGCIQRALMGVQIGATPIQDDLYVEYALQFAPQGSQRPITALPASAPQSGGTVQVNGNVTMPAISGSVTVDPRRGVVGRSNVSVGGNVSVDVNAGM